MKLRPYQREAIDSLYTYFEKNTGNPLLVLPTGAGKSVVQAMFIKEVVEQWPDQRFMLVTHVKELLQQNTDKLKAVWPEADVGMYSAGLGKKQLGHQITVAGIQSAYKKAHEFGIVNIIMIDEAHLLSPKSGSMYQQFLSELLKYNPKMKAIGMTATPYRLDSGLLTDGPNNIFTDICYSAIIQHLIKDGYLSDLRTKNSKAKGDLSSVHMRGGEYIPGELEDAMNTPELVAATVDEAITLAEGRGKLLVFCCGVEHAKAVSKELTEKGVNSECVYGELGKSERAEILEKFSSGHYRALTNINVLTTGFDQPDVDCLVCLRPTQSTGLWVQMIGRGMRIADGKKDCLVLDFTENTVNHGPVDSVTVKKKGDGDGEAATPRQEELRVQS